MAQKLYLIEGVCGSDLLQEPTIAAAISAGYEVSSVDGYATRDNRHMLAVLLSEAAQAEAEAETPAAGDSESTGTEGEGTDSEGTGADSETTTEP